MRPQVSAFGEDAFPTIHEKAAALLHGLARNHPFLTGNKRTAWTAMAMFYLVNGYNLPVEAGDVIKPDDRRCGGPDRRAGHRGRAEGLGAAFRR